MQERRASNWARCPKCGHKLFKILDTDSTIIEMSLPSADKIRGLRADSILETKCHSCKEIVDIRLARI